MSTNCTWPGSELSTRFRSPFAAARAWLGLPLSAVGSACTCTCHCTPVGIPGTAAAPAADGGTAASAGASVRAKVLRGKIAMSAGGWAGAGPSRGLSG
ncbi:MAG: hypothetical protein E6G67_08045 [Actinobacteria bacterium]|nr:MAG: hypothetical protein E6G67_08045 [Actinomycetota bacterium]